MYTVPVATLFDEGGKLKLKGVDLSVYLYCCRLANVQWSSGAGTGNFMFQIEDVTANTGWGERSVWYALRDLQGLAEPKAGNPTSPARNRLIVGIEGKCKRPFHMFSLATDSGSALSDLYFESQSEQSPLRKFLFDKRLWYHDIPRHLMDNLKVLKGAPLAIALTAYQLALDKEHVQFAVKFAKWSERAGVARKSLFENAWACSAFKKFIHASQLRGDEEVQVAFYHPTKGTSLLHTRTNAASRALWREVDRPISEYNGDDRDYTSGEITRSNQYFYPDAELNADGVLVVECPNCRGTRGGHRAAYPTLRFNPDKGRFGVMYCGADVNNRGTKCDYGVGKMSYHLLAERRRIRPGEAMQLFESYIRELRGQQSNAPSPEDRIPI